MYQANLHVALEPKNLSRILEDSGTLPWCLIPAALTAAALGVPTIAYLPYAFFNLINPLVSIIYGYTGFTITRIKDDVVLATR
jgi:NhaC family Na+:H+ antiporter